MTFTDNTSIAWTCRCGVQESRPYRDGPPLNWRLPGADDAVGTNPLCPDCAPRLGATAHDLAADR